MQHQDVLSIFGKGHQVGFPVTGLAAVVGSARSLVQAFAMLDGFDAADAATPEPAATMFALRQEAVEPVFLGDLMIDVTID